jgi:uncharacterized protein with FMN-binding domain
MVTGRTAGANAAAVKPADAPIRLSSVRSNLAYTLGSYREEEPEFVLDAGEFLGTGEGMGGPITVKVRLEGQRMVEVEVLTHSETPGISDGALAGIPQAILRAQSAEVDVISGASLTSRGIMAGVKQALEAAR